MFEQKIEAFLTQMKSLDTLSLSLVEELRLSKVQNQALESAKNRLEEEVRILKQQCSQLEQEKASLEDAQKHEAVAPKAKKAKKSMPKTTEHEAPTLF